MSQINDNIKLEVRRNDGAVDNTFAFSYSELSLIDTISDASQIIVFYNIQSVWTGPNETGTEVALSGQSEEFNLSVREVDPSLLTFNETNSTVTVGPITGALSLVASDGATYYYPSTNEVNTTTFVTLRRSTSVDSRITTFEAGSRLTSEGLNLANTQVFNAIQELTRYGLSTDSSSGGSGGGGGTVDLSNSSINELSNVESSFGVFAGVLSWNPATGLVEVSASSGNFVPTVSNATTNEVLMVTSSTTYGWEQLNATQINRTAAISSPTLDSWLSTDVTDRINANIADIDTLEAATAGFTRDAGTTTTTFSDTLAGGTVTATSVTSTSVAADSITLDGTDLDTRIDAIEATKYIVQKWLGGSDPGTTTGNLQFFDHSDWGQNPPTLAYESVSGIGAQVGDAPNNTTPWTFPADWPAGVYEFRASCSLDSAQVGEGTLSCDIDGTTSDVVYKSQTMNSNSGEQLLQGSWFFTVVPGTTTIRPVISATSGTIDVNAASYVLQQVS